jgi:hypothetical protein
MKTLSDIGELFDFGYFDIGESESDAQSGSPSVDSPAVLQ